jgi:hypothetical protein
MVGHTAREELGLARERFVHPLKAALVMMVAETIGGVLMWGWRLEAEQ